MPSDIFSNIVGFAPTLGVDDAWQAARLAGLEDDIRAMPMGMHTLVGEGGGNLSSGQRQRLLIARAIVHRPQDPPARRGHQRPGQRHPEHRQRQPDQPAPGRHPGRDRASPRRDRQGRSHLRPQGRPDRPVRAIRPAPGRAGPVPRPGPPADALSSISRSTIRQAASVRPRIRSRGCRSLLERFTIALVKPAEPPQPPLRKGGWGAI